MNFTSLIYIDTFVHIQSNSLGGAGNLYQFLQDWIIFLPQGILQNWP